MDWELRRLCMAGRSDGRPVSGYRMTAWPMSQVEELNCRFTASKIGRGMVQMVSRLPLALDVRVYTQAILCGICGGPNGTGIGFLPW